MKQKSLHTLICDYNKKGDEKDLLLIIDNVKDLVDKKSYEISNNYNKEFEDVQSELTYKIIKLIKSEVSTSTKNINIYKILREENKYYEEEKVSYEYLKIEKEYLESMSKNFYDPEYILLQNERIDKLNYIINNNLNLSVKTKYIFKSLHMEGKTISQTAKEAKVTNERARNLYRKILFRLKWRSDFKELYSEYYN